LRWGLVNFLWPELAWNCDCPNLSLQHNWDDKCMSTPLGIGGAGGSPKLFA
jgi:hypothetical protein